MSDPHARARRRPSRDYRASEPSRSNDSAAVRKREKDSSSPQESVAKVVKRADEERPSTSAPTALARAAGGSGRDEAQRRRRQRYDVLHTRPDNCFNKQGTSGQPIRLQANYFRVDKKESWSIHQYSVSFEPDIEVRKVRCGIIGTYAGLLGGYMFDGKQLFNTIKLPDVVTTIEHVSNNGDKHVINIKYVGAIMMTEAQSLHVLNLIIRRSMSGLKLQTVGRDFFDPAAKIDMREFRLQLWPGYQTSMRQHESCVLLNVDIMHKVMRTETAYDILRRCTQTARDYRDDFRRQIIGMSVLTDYNNRIYRVQDVTFDLTPKHTFNWKGTDTSFIDYYKRNYNIRIRDPAQPMLISANKEKPKFGNKDKQEERTIILVPELCRVTGLSDEMHSNFQLMRAMAEHTRMNPERRIERLRTYNSRLRGTAESVKVLNDWKLSIDKNLVEVEGRILEPQRIIFAGRNIVSAGNQGDWSRCFRDAHLLTSPSRGLHRWHLIAPGRNSREVRNFMNALVRAASGLRFEIFPPQEIMLYEDRTATYLKALEGCAREDPQLIMCIVPTNSAERYAAIKKKCCLDRAVPTQVVTLKCASNQRGLMSIATKVAVQLNSKLGYTPWMVNMQVPGLMAVGYDVVRSTKDRNKAYGALVATMDMQVNPTFFSTVAECGSNDIVATQIWPMLIKALRQYRKEHDGKLPNRILLYRCGLPDGSLAHVYDEEVKMLVQNLQAEYQKTDVTKTAKFGYINVSTRLNTYFFDRAQNVPPGTVVDSVVTLPERYDFFLVSQSVRQGTAAPTLYNVLYTNLGFTPDQLQMLTYKLTHLYYNWSGTTRVPAVTQYAKKLATLVAMYLHSTHQNVLEKKLYYL